MRKKDKLIHGIGINDADYNVYITTKTEGKKKIIWICPFYRCWKNIFKRCYGESWLEQYTTYIGSTTTEEWKYFSNFKSWMEQQDWENNELDKDILLQAQR